MERSTDGRPFSPDIPRGNGAVDSTLVVRRVPLSVLHQDPGNVRTHGRQNMLAIRQSLARFGQAEPIVVQRSTGRVIGGNGRLAAMTQLGWTECDIVELELDDKQAKALAVALNRTAELAAWDEPALAKLLEQLRAEDSLEGVGYTDDDIDALLAQLGQDVEPNEIDDPGPADPPEQPITRRGDLWLLGDHRLLCGDSTSSEDMARLMCGEKASLLATDPPYLVSYDGSNHPAEHHRKAGRKAGPGKEVGNRHWDDYIDPETSVEFFAAWLRTALEHCVERVPVYQWHATRRQALVEQAWEQNGLLVHQTVVWVKSRGVLTRSHFLWQHEPCYYGWPKGFMPEKERRPPPNERTVWQIDQAGQQDGIHPTQKPTAVFEKPLGFHTHAREIVLEPFSGSGTQIIAAEKLGRRCFAMELSPAFVDVAVRRWEKATGKRATLDGDERTLDEIAAERRRTGKEVSDGEAPTD